MPPRGTLTRARAHSLARPSPLQDLWLVFGILSFSLNFIPNVGMFTAVCLPMPLVALDPRSVRAHRPPPTPPARPPPTPPHRPSLRRRYSGLQVATAFFLPLLFGSFSKDVLEPWLIGDATSLQPVALMLAILMWGSIWGVTGMILAVPITAVMRIYLEHLDHPLPKYIAKILAGKGQGHAKPEPRDGAPAMV